MCIGEVYGSSCLDNLFPGSGGGSGANVRPGKVNMFTPLAGQGGSGGAAVLLRSSNGSLVVTTTGKKVLRSSEDCAGTWPWEG